MILFQNTLFGLLTKTRGPGLVSGADFPHIFHTHIIPHQLTDVPYQTSLLLKILNNLFFKFLVRNMMTP